MSEKLQTKVRVGKNKIEMTLLQGNCSWGAVIPREGVTPELLDKAIGRVIIDYTDNARHRLLIEAVSLLQDKDSE